MTNAPPPLSLVEDPPALALTTAELEKRVWEALVIEGKEARTEHDDTNWRVGRAAVKVAELFAQDQEGKPIEDKERFILRDYAIAIGMIDNPKLIYEIKNTAAFWSESAQAHFKDCTWSAFRECARHKLTSQRASIIMHLHGHEPVAKIRAAILAGRNEPITYRKTFPCTLKQADGVRALLEMIASDIVSLKDVLTRGGATLELRVSWLEER